MNGSIRTAGPVSLTVADFVSTVRALESIARSDGPVRTYVQVTFPDVVYPTSHEWQDTLVNDPRPEIELAELRGTHWEDAVEVQAHIKGTGSRWISFAQSPYAGRSASVYAQSFKDDILERLESYCHGETQGSTKTPDHRIQTWHGEPVLGTY